MPRIAADPSDFTAKLEAARAAAAPGAIVSAAGLAKATGITWRILEKWIDRDGEAPVLSRGSVGAPWKFDLVAILDHFVARARSLAAGKEARSAEVARLAGLGSGSGGARAPADAGPGAAADRAAEARALSALVDARMKTHRLAREQHDLVDRAATEALMAMVMTTMQTEVLAISAKLDPAGLFSPEQRLAMEAELRSALVTVQDRLAAKLPEWRRSAHP